MTGHQGPDASTRNAILAFGFLAFLHRLRPMTVIRFLPPLLCTFIGLCLLPALPVAAFAQVMPEARVLINDAPPYRIVAPAGGGRNSYTGIYVDILRAAAAEAGIGLRFIETPYARGFAMMEAGDADIMLGPNRTPEREAYLLYLDPALPAEPKAVVLRPGALPVATYDDLRGLRIAVLRGARYFPRFDADETMTRIPTGDYESALRLLSGDRADAVIIPELQARWLLRRLGANLQFAEFRAPGEPSHIVLARNSPLPGIAGRLEAALRRLQRDGEIARILKLYG